MTRTLFSAKIWAQSGTPESKCFGIRDRLPFIFLVVTISYWFLVKAVKFEGLSYCYDLFNSLQIATSIWKGRPIFHYYDLGELAYLHNYFFSLLLGPAVLTFGPYFLFFVSSAMLGWASWGVISLGQSATDKVGRTICWLALFLFLLGPYSFWIFDDMPLGWNVEGMLLPLSVLLTLSLISGGKERWLWWVCFVLIKENGPVLAWTLHSLSLIRHQRLNQLPTRIFFERLVRVTVIWLLLFLLHLMVIHYFSTAGSSRIGHALQGVLALFSSPTDLRLFEKELGRFIIFLLPLVLPLLLLRGRIRVGWLIVIASPLVGIVVVETLAYSSPGQLNAFASSTVPARFVVPLSFLTSAFLFAASSPVDENKKRTISSSYIGICIVSLVLQCINLQTIRGYPILLHFAVPIAPTLLPLNSLAYSTTELRFLSCLGNKLPESTKAVIEPPFQRYFPLHQMASTVGALAVDSASDEFTPDVIICDSAYRFSGLHLCSSDTEGMFTTSSREIEVEGIVVRIREPLTKVADACARGRSF